MTACSPLFPYKTTCGSPGDQLAGDFASWKLTTIAQHGMVKIRNYQRSTLADPYERVGKMLFADVPYDEFIQAMPTFFVSAAGKQLYQELRGDQPNFAAYYAAMSEQEGVPLLEFCFVNALQAVWP
jgi:hypothetical protein